MTLFIMDDQMYFASSNGKWNSHQDDITFASVVQDSYVNLFKNLFQKKGFRFCFILFESW